MKPTSKSQWRNAAVGAHEGQPGIHDAVVMLAGSAIELNLAGVGSAWVTKPKLNDLARAMGVAVPVVRSRCKRLIDSGWLESLRDDGAAPVWVLCQPQGVSS